jgi:hypothetical protein
LVRNFRRLRQFFGIGHHSRRVTVVFCPVEGGFFDVDPDLPIIGLVLLPAGVGLSNVGLDFRDVNVDFPNVDLD